MSRRHHGITAALACSALLLASCSGDDSTPKGDTTGSTGTGKKAAIEVKPAAGGKWHGKTGDWKTATPSWAPWRRHVPINAGGQVWYLAKNAQDEFGIASFSASKPGKVKVTKLPWKTDTGTDELKLRLASSSNRPVVVLDDTESEDGGYEAVSVDPSTHKMSKPAVKKVASPDGDKSVTWSRATPATLISTTTGAYTEYNATTNKWAPGPAPAHAGRVLTKVGTKTVEWVGHGKKPGAVYIGDTKLGLKLSPGPKDDEADETDGPTDTVTPLASTDAWALLAIHTEGGNPDAPTSRLVVARPGQTSAKPVPLEDGGTFEEEDWTTTDVGSLTSDGAAQTAALTNSQDCITVDRSGTLTVNKGDGSTLSLVSFDGKTAYFDAAGEDSAPATATCTVGSSGTMKEAQEPTVPPVLFTKTAAIFHSQPAGEDSAQMDELVTLKR